MPARKRSVWASRVPTMSPPWLWPMMPMRRGSATPISTALATAASASATSWGTKVSYVVSGSPIIGMVVASSTA